MASPAVEGVGVHCAVDRPVSRELARIRTGERVERIGEERATTGSHLLRVQAARFFVPNRCQAQPNRSRTQKRRELVPAKGATRLWHL